MGVGIGRSVPVTTCYVYRGGDERERRRPTHATPPLRGNRTFLSDPFCTVTEDSEGLSMLMCPVEEDDESPELGPTFRYVEWDLTEEVTGRGGDDGEVPFQRSVGGSKGEPGGEEEDEEAREEEEAAESVRGAGTVGHVKECFVGEDEYGMPAVDCQSV